MTSYPHQNKQYKGLPTTVDFLIQSYPRKNRISEHIQNSTFLHPKLSSLQQTISRDIQNSRPLYLQTEQTISDNSQYRRPLYLQTEQTISDNSQYRRPLYLQTEQTI